MSAIITNQFRKNSRELFINDIEDSTTDDYFIGIGKTEPWPTLNGVDESNLNYAVPLPTNTLIEKEDTLKNLISLLKVQTTFNVVPRNQWRSGRKYKVYDPSDPNIFNFETIGAEAYYPCYATVEVSGVNKIFVCLDNNDGGASSEMTTASGYVSPVILSDGYVWAFVCDLESTSDFYTDQFIPLPNDITGADETNAFNATGGVVYGFNVIDGGTGLTGNEEIRLVGKTGGGGSSDVIIRTGGNDEVDFDVVITGGSIQSIKYVGSGTTSLTVNWKANFVDASIIVVDSSSDIKETNIKPLVAPIGGFGLSAKDDLPSFYAGLFVKYEGAEDGEVPVNVGFRQVSLVKGAARTDNDNPANASTNLLDALKYFDLDTHYSESYDAGTIIEHKTTQARAYLDYVEPAGGNNRVYYHQNSSEEINEKPFSTGEVEFISSGVTSSGTYNISAASDLGEGEYNSGSGEAIFLENRKAILRNDNQQEDIKLVIQF